MVRPVLRLGAMILGTIPLAIGCNEPKPTEQTVQKASDESLLSFTKDENGKIKALANPKILVEPANNDDVPNSAVYVSNFAKEFNRRDEIPKKIINVNVSQLPCTYKIYIMSDGAFALKPFAEIFPDIAKYNKGIALLKPACFNSKGVPISFSLLDKYRFDENSLKSAKYTEHDDVSVKNAPDAIYFEVKHQDSGERFPFLIDVTNAPLIVDDGPQVIIIGNNLNL